MLLPTKTINHASTALLFVSLLVSFSLLSGCASAPITIDEIQNTRYGCTDVTEKIAILEAEKKENNKRVLAGVRSVFPIAVVSNLLRGRYQENVKIAIGKWAEILDEEILEMEVYKTQCWPQNQTGDER